MYTVIDLDTIDSTNSFAKRELSAFLPDRPTFVVAREQSGGRGRASNSWLSPRDQNLYLTLAEPVRPPLELIHYSYCAALAVASVLESYGVTPQLKWPNDLLAGKKKICGILVEGASLGRQPWAIVGIGLNVAMDPSLLASLDQPATSLHEIVACPPSVNEVRQKTIDVLLSTLASASEDPKSFQERFVLSFSWMKGMEAAVQTAEGVVRGTVDGFSPEGHLLLMKADGIRLSIAQGVISST